MPGLGDTAFAEATELKWGHWGGPGPTWRVGHRSARRDDHARTRGNGHLHTEDAALTSDSGLQGRAATKSRCRSLGAGGASGRRHGRTRPAPVSGAGCWSSRGGRNRPRPRLSEELSCVRGGGRGLVGLGGDHAARAARGPRRPGPNPAALKMAQGTAPHACVGEGVRYAAAEGHWTWGVNTPQNTQMSTDSAHLQMI